MATAVVPTRKSALHVIPPTNPGHGVEYGRFLDCIHCGLCLAACPTYEELGTEADGPRGRIYLMRAVTDGRLQVDAGVRKHLDSCLDCRACETACPSGVRYHELLEPFRAGLDKIGMSPEPLPWIQRLVLNHIFPYRGRSRWALAPVRLLQRSGIDRLFKNSGLLSLLPRSMRRLYDTLPELLPHHGRLAEFYPAEGKRRARVGFFVGCVADAVYPQTNLATIRVLQANGCDVVVPKSQGCCGALDFHNHQENRARTFGRKNMMEFDPSIDAIINNAAGCGAMLKDYPMLFRGSDDSVRAERFTDRVKDIAEFLIDLGPITPTHPVRIKATYHDACHLRHAQQVFSEPRKLLSIIPGLEIVPLPESELCCGAAGSYNLTQPEMSARLGERKAERILATGADAVLTGNVGCLLQVSKYLREKRPNFIVAHPVDALWASYSGGKLNG